MGNIKKYWNSLTQPKDNSNSPANSHEFGEEIPLDVFLGDKKLEDSGTHRRDFLKFLGFSVTAASLAACETPVALGGGQSRPQFAFGRHVYPWD